MTNIASAAKEFPAILDNVRDIFIMGGNIKGNKTVENCCHLFGEKSVNKFIYFPAKALTMSQQELNSTFCGIQNRLPQY